ncbi:hypothetical protein VP01_4049g1 [Puccinia sorghi]|uniref:Uncharacterized protein n=1 Tax=Puccinia sorghi TaxID=27349 RepID=A0A0L6URM8_9BASI|nr:hypothetical protein VP01_4049g1 [Puccinia sorghi]
MDSTITMENYATWTNNINNQNSNKGGNGNQSPKYFLFDHVLNLPKAFKIGFSTRLNSYSDAGPLIQDATRATPPIKWLVYLLRSPSLPQFTKYSGYHISNFTSLNAHRLKTEDGIPWCHHKLIS